MVQKLEPFKVWKLKKVETPNTDTFHTVHTPWICQSRGFEGNRYRILARNGLTNSYRMNDPHCVKSVRILSYSGPHFSRIFPYSDWLRKIRSNMGKIRTRITPDMDIFYAIPQRSIQNVVNHLKMEGFVKIISYLNNSAEYFLKGFCICLWSF